MFFVNFIKAAITLFWIFDVCNIPFMEMFDTIYPLNGLFWFLIWMCSGNISITNKEDDE